METIKGDLADLRSLCAVVEQGSITLAAKILGESKGSLSRRITRLEQQLGVKLLNRSSRAISTTIEGRSFYHRSLQALALLDEGATELRNTHLEPSGLLRLTMSVDFGLSVFPPLIAEFLELYPKIDIEVLLDEAFLDLKTHQIDIAFRINALPDSTYSCYHLADLSGCLFASPQYLQQHGYPTTPNDLLARSMLLDRAFSNQPTIFRQGNSSIQVNLHGRIITNDFVYLKEMAIAGAGIAVLPDFLANIDCKSGKLVRVLPQWSIGADVPLYLLHESWRLLPAKVTCFRDFIGDRFKTLSFAP